MKRRVAYGWIGLATLVAVAAGCSEQRSERTPVLLFEPATFSFPELALGDRAARDVVLRNTGSGKLVIHNIELDDKSSGGELTLFQKTESGDLQEVPGSFELAPGGDASVTLTVRYEPTDDSPRRDSGSVRMETNAPDALAVAIEITTGGQGAEIRVSPASLDFGVVEAGAVGEQVLTIQNVGVAALVINRVGCCGNGDFGLRLGDRTLNGDLGADPIVMAPNGSIELTATYAPQVQGPDDGELTLESNDAISPVVTVPMRANGAAPCIRLTPDSLEFPGALIEPGGPDPESGPVNVRPVSVESCGDTTLRVTDVTFDGGSGTFALAEEPFEPFELPAAQPDSVPPSEVIRVAFSPPEVNAYGGVMWVHSNAADSPTRVDLFGRGVENSCPQAVPTEREYHVRPLDIITLDGTPSDDPGGQVKKWRWTVVSRPDGSVSQPVERFGDLSRPADGGVADDETTPQAFFFVDLAGSYELELSVVDDLETESCEPARITIDAVPDKDLHVQLVWTTPDDPDETDNIGVDIDLHLRHENAGDAWSNAANGWDCYFHNKTPDWGVQGEVADNPTLDIDDTNGAGPENINLASPEVGVTYDIGALYFRAESTFGVQGADPRLEHQTYVTLRVFVRGDPMFELIHRELSSARQLWHIASVRWCQDQRTCPEITPIDVVLEEADYAQP